MAIRFRKALGPELSKIVGIQVAETDVADNYRNVDMIDYSISPNEAPSTSQQVAGYEEPIVTVGEADPTGVTVNGPFVPGTEGYELLGRVIASGAAFFLQYAYRAQAIFPFEALSASKTIAISAEGAVTFAGTSWTNAGTNSDPIKQKRNILTSGMAIEYRTADDAAPTIYIIDRFAKDATEADPTVMVTPPAAALATANSGSVGISIPVRTRKLQVRATQAIGETATVGELVSGSIALVVDNDAGWTYTSGLATS